MATKPLKAEVIGDQVKLTYACFWCGKPNVITVGRAEYNRHEAGEFVQQVWPDLSAADRETIQSGTHDACFDEMFGSEPEEVFEDDAS